MQTPTDVTNLSNQLSLDEGMDVLVRALEKRQISKPALAHSLESLPDRGGVPGGQHTDLGQRLGPGQASGHVVLEKLSVERERCLELKHIGIRCLVEPS